MHDDRLLNYDELDDDELIEILRLHPFAYCSAWEQNFCESLIDRLEAGIELTERQIAVLEKGLLKSLQDNDPHLWDMPREIIDE